MIDYIIILSVQVEGGRTMKFFAIDCHIGINDIKCIFEALGHTLDVWSISRAAPLMGWEQREPDILNNKSWYSFNHNMAYAFAEKYRDVLETYDGFVCFYPASFSLIYSFFNKPIIIQAPIRTDVPFHFSPEYSEAFYDFLKENITAKKIIPLANNRVDKEYNEILTDSSWKLIPSLCDYTSAKHKPSLGKHIYSTQNRFELPKIKGLELASGFSGMSWKEIYSYQGIVHIPYHNSIMSCFEQYSAGVPLFFPSHAFLKKLKTNFPNKIMNEMSWQQIDKRSPLQRQSFTNKSIPDLANWTSKESFEYWSLKCDWYDTEWMPGINLYDSFEHLSEMINQNNYSVQTGLSERKNRILNLWKQVLDKI